MKGRGHSIDLIVQQLEQTGIDIRQSGQTTAMQKYIQHLKDELRMTEQFLTDDVKAAEVFKERGD